MEVKKIKFTEGVSKFRIESSNCTVHFGADGKVGLCAHPADDSITTSVKAGTQWCNVPIYCFDKVQGQCADIVVFIRG